MSARSPTNPHAPERGIFGKLLGPFHVTGVFWFKFHGFGARVCPMFLRAPLIRLFTTGFFPFLVGIRRAVADNLEPVLGPTGALGRMRRAYRTLLTFAWCLTERYERLCTDVDFEVRPDGLERWERALDRGRGLIVVTAHVGNWEMGSSIPSSRHQVRMHVVREEELDPKAQAYVESLLAERMGPNYTTHFAGEDPRLALELVEALDAGDVVALQADRPRAGGRTVPTELFGRPYSLPVGPLALARTARVDILPAFVLREGRLTYRMCFRPPIEVPKTTDRTADLQTAARRLTEAIEWAIRERPHQWFCFHRLWRERDGRLEKTPPVRDHRNQA